MRYEDALELIRNDQHLTEIMTYETRTIHHIVDLAINHPENISRWDTYTQMKELASQIAGKYAQHSELATTRHYEALMNCIDAILPINEEQRECEQSEIDEYEEDE